MKVLRTYSIMALLASSLAIACTNPSDRVVKGNSYKDEEDTTKKKKDSIQPQERVNPEDTIRRY
ncbi:hypothetical protein [Pedobacter endophyticus]|uniref:Lipoprotein n=1 Tax=Pedobacter endophyticus TaxID=2789740 RepID=A0A7S9L0U6_9SPHI|nr:hypothetical protein [Pedobacter endophyticus]QPH40425.1 hypothetical protein IZT61_03850 [Pedobacter endophyticus]